MVVVGIFVFFQAEDGIRDLVRSRGLGDVYKRQGRTGPRAQPERMQRRRGLPACGAAADFAGRRCHPVSYTHLTLPTSDLV